MKRFILSTVMAASSFFAMSSAQALEIEVAPLKPQIKAEVLGIRADINGQALVQDALVLTGRTAALVAASAGIALDTSLEMLVLTGEEVSDLINKTIGGTLKVGQTALIQTSKLSKMALHMTLAIVQDSARFTVRTADVGFDLVSNVLRKSARISLVVVSDAGRFVFAATNGVFAALNFALRAVLNLIGIVL